MSNVFAIDALFVIPGCSYEALFEVGLCLACLCSLAGLKFSLHFIQLIADSAHKELLSLKSMHGTTRCEDLFAKLVSAMNKLERKFEKLCGLTTDGAPAMDGLRKRSTADVKNN